MWAFSDILLNQTYYNFIEHNSMYSSVMNNVTDKFIMPIEAILYANTDYIKFNVPNRKFDFAYLRCLFIPSFQTLCQKMVIQRFVSSTCDISQHLTYMYNYIGVSMQHMSHNTFKCSSDIFNIYTMPVLI